MKCSKRTFHLMFGYETGLKSDTIYEIHKDVDGHFALFSPCGWGRWRHGVQ